MADNIANQYIVLKKYVDEKDYAEIYELEKLCKEQDKVNLKFELDYKLLRTRDYEKSLHDINEFLYYINGELAGYLGIASFGSNLGELNGAVHPSWRRKGIFTKLCKLAIEESRIRGFNKILLLCDDKSVTAKEFIKSTGAVYSFSECGMKLNSRKAAYEYDNEIVLRKAVNADMEEIQRQNRVFFGSEGSEPVMPEDEEKNNAITYMVELKGKIIGKIKVSREQSSAFISGFGIIPEYRGKNYGKQALREVLNMLNKAGIYDVALDVAVENSKALGLYKSCGFEEQSAMNYYEVK
jgi:ribosomal protein S18 acetylase RimI-like enzyme